MNIGEHLHEWGAELLSFIAWLAAWSSFYLPTIQLVTCLTCAAIALVILLLRKEILEEERWAQYFGLAFAVFAAQYALQTVANWYLGWGYGPPIATLKDLALTKYVAHVVGSTGNNLLFLASARALLGHKSWRQQFPLWALLFALVAAATAVFVEDPFLQRLPDMVFSAICLVTLGWAMYVNFRTGKRHRFAYLNVVGGLLYAAAHLFYAVSPLLVTSTWAYPLLERVKSKQASLHTLQPSTPLRTPLDGLDAFVFGVAFLLKILLFVGALLLIMKCLVVLAPAQKKAALGRVIEGDREYLRHDTLLQALGESVEADLAVLCFRLPGVDTDQVAWWRWLRDRAVSLQNPEITPAPPADQWSVGRVLATGVEQSSPNIPKDSKAVYFPYVSGMRAFVTTPVKYQGAVIGALNVEWRRERSYTRTAQLRLNQLASHIAPTVHARRQLIALNQISQELRDCERLCGGLCLDNVEKILFSIQRNLNPIACAFHLTAGFEPIAVAMDRGCKLERFSDVNSLTAVAHAFRVYTRQPMTSIGTALRVQNRTIGRLFFAVENGKDSITEPALARDFLERHTVAASLVETLFASLRNHFEDVLRQLQTSFDESPATVTLDVWCERIGWACREAGVRDAVAVLANGERRLLLGSTEFENYIRRNAALLNTLAREATGGVDIMTLPDGGMLIPLSVRGVSAALWLRVVALERFGWELSQASPWKYFLDGLTQIADSALARMEQEKLRSEATQLVMLGTRVEVAGMMYHEVKHKAFDLATKAQTVKDMFQLEDMNAMQQSVAELEELADILNSVAGKLMQPLRLDSSSVISLKDIVEQVIRLEPQLIADIRLQIQIAPELVATMPSEVIALATNNVVSNAIEKLDGRDEKEIRIEAETKGADILLHITDTGPSVDPAIRSNLFVLDETAKSASRGIGLPLASSALRRNKGNIYLDPTSRAGWNRFTIQLPLLKENQRDIESTHPINS